MSFVYVEKQVRMRQQVYQKIRLLDDSIRRVDADCLYSAGMVCCIYRVPGHYLRRVFAITLICSAELPKIFIRWRLK